MGPGLTKYEKKCKLVARILGGPCFHGFTTHLLVLHPNFIENGSSVKMGMGRPGPGLGPGPMALRPILEVMSRPIFPRWYGLEGSLGIMGRPKYFFIILNHEYYQHF